MTAPGRLLVCACTELRLAWRDMIAMMTAGRRRPRAAGWAVGAGIIVLILHGVAFAGTPPLPMRASSATDLSTRDCSDRRHHPRGSAMLSQAMENVTRTFYTRSDLELILSAPIAGRAAVHGAGRGDRVLGRRDVRSFLSGPFIDVLAFEGGGALAGGLWRDRWPWRWSATALGILLTVFLFQIIGPKRTRLAGTDRSGLDRRRVRDRLAAGRDVLDGLALAHGVSAIAVSPRMRRRGSLFWFPARAAWASGMALVCVLVARGLRCSLRPLFSACRALAAYGAIAGGARCSERRWIAREQRPRISRGARREQPSAARRCCCSRRDPWLISQSLMQLLYLVAAGCASRAEFPFGESAPRSCSCPY